MGNSNREFDLAVNGRTVPFLVENTAYEGVKRIASKVAADVEKVSGSLPETASCVDAAVKLADRVVFCATLDKSPLLDKMAGEGKLDPSCIRGKREVYLIRLVEDPWDGVKEALVICGSDKRGTIYGMFALSEYIGVSPLCYWGDAEPLRRSDVRISVDIETVSREPSVKYRGFFINDEWPCFGNWTFSHFGGFTAEMYDHVFELLLRLKGNYLWPAMWTSSFPLDGPGSLNEELADIYGVVIGFSHHEPCLRSSEEWDKVRGPESVYGNEWNFYTNREGLTRYWEDSLIRSGKYENLITIGMRGERDSSMLGPDASLKQNIDLLKDIITTQRELIRRHVNPDLNQVPQLLALYKEVEAYFYGDEATEGLKDWEGLEGVTCMLCEDNFGHMRTLPAPELREKVEGRGGGFGMYYHFDYHGGPVSYEWMPSTPFSKTWEQMCMAYEYGVRDVWIVNVGDLKGNETALAYFLALAYDYDTWGISAPGSWETFTSRWLLATFPEAGEAVREQMGLVLTEFIQINSMRRPEALHPGIYHPCHYLETDRMLERAAGIERVNEAVMKALEEKGLQKARNAYYSMIGYPARASINLLRMHLYAGKNSHYAGQGKTIANFYAQKVTECIREDRRLGEEFAAFLDGKWKGMELEQHIGFVKWNEDNCRYPLRIQVEPAYKPRMTVSRKDSEMIAVKNYGGPMEIQVDDFLYEGNEEVVLEIANDGVGEICYRIESVDENGSILTGAEGDGTVCGRPGKCGADAAGTAGKDRLTCGWLTAMPASGIVAVQQDVILTCDRSKLGKEIQTMRLLIQEAETTVAVVVRAKSDIPDNLPSKTFLENAGVTVMEANHWALRHDTARGGFRELKGYGRSGYGMKVFPVTEDFEQGEDAPSLTYRFYLEKADNYRIEVWSAPVNSVRDKRPLRFGLQAGGVNGILEAVSAGFRAGDPGDSAWCQGVLDQIRVTGMEVHLEQGLQSVTVSALEAGLVVERILVYPKGRPPRESYLGPVESFYIE